MLSSSSSSCSLNSIQHIFKLNASRGERVYISSLLELDSIFNKCSKTAIEGKVKGIGSSSRQFGPKNSSLIVEFVLSGIHLPRIIDMKIVNPITFSNQTISSHQCSFSSLHRIISHDERGKR